MATRECRKDRGAWQKRLRPLTWETRDRAGEEDCPEAQDKRKSGPASRHPNTLASVRLASRQNPSPQPPDQNEIGDKREALRLGDEKAVEG